MEASLRLGSERMCFENGNLISLISNKSSHLEGMALTLRWGSTRHMGRVEYVFEVVGIYGGDFGLFQVVFILKMQRVNSGKSFFPSCHKMAAKGVFLLIFFFLVCNLQASCFCSTVHPPRISRHACSSTAGAATTNSTASPDDMQVDY